MNNFQLYMHENVNEWHLISKMGSGSNEAVCAIKHFNLIRADKYIRIKYQTCRYHPVRLNLKDGKFSSRLIVCQIQNKATPFFYCFTHFGAKLN